MKILKDDTQSLMLRPVGIQDKLYAVVTVFIFFDLINPDAPLKEQELWATIPALLGDGGILDQGMSKPRGEVIVKGSCLAPDGKPVRAMSVLLKAGDLYKELAFFGDRYWIRNAAGLNTISEPIPFREMFISWENAFGGGGYAKNPSGKGISTVLLKDGSQAVPLLNIEYPRQLIGLSSDRPEPAGFGPIDMMWPQRAKKQGSYDQKWLNERWPCFPADMDYEFFNVAPEDQCIRGFFSGGEPIEIVHMHPDMPVVNSFLPRLRMRCFVTKKTSLKKEKQAEEIFQEVTTRIDTVWLFPSVLRGVLVFRGSTEILDEEFADISNVFLASERTDEPQKPIEKYLEEQKKSLTVPCQRRPKPALMM